MDTLVGGSRVLVDESGAIEIAPDLLGVEIATVARTGDAYLFLDGAGEVYRASSFLAPLEHLGAIGLASFDPQTGSPGRLAVVSEMNVYTTTGTLPAVRAGLPPGTVHDASFRDADHGVALLDGGAVMVTADGGATWRLLDVGGPSAWVGAGDGRVAVLRAAQPPELFIVGEDGTGGTVEALSFTQPAELVPALAGELAFARAFPALGIDQGRRDPGVVRTRLASGTILLRRDQAQLVRVDPRAGSTEVLPDLPTGCYFQRWGVGVAVLCVGAPEGTLVHRLDERGALERAFNATAMEPTHFSRDGRSAAWRGGCPGGPNDQLCVVREATGFQHEAHSLYADRVGTPAGDWSLVSTGSDAELHLLRMSAGAFVPVAIPADRTPRVATLSADGALLAIVASRGDDEGRVLLVGPPGGPLEERSLPEGVRGVAFLDAQRGFAVGSCAATLARTFDGGASWEALPSPVEGDPSRVEVFTEALVDAPIACDPLGCWAGESTLAFMLGWGPTLDTRTVRARGTPSEVTYELTGLTSVALACEAASDTAPRAPTWRGRVPQGALAVTRSLGPRGSARITLAAGRARVEWRGEDARGAYAVSTRDTQLAELSAGIDPRLVSILGASRTGVDLAVCPQSMCRIFHARAGGALVELPDTATATIGTVAVHMGLPDGRDAVVVADPTGSEAVVVHAIGADGSRAVLGRAAVPGFRRRVGIAQRAPGELAVVAERPGRPGFLVIPLSGDTVPRVMGDGADLAVCPDAPGGADAWTVTLVGGPDGDGNAGSLDTVWTVTIELSDAGACLRAVRLVASAEPEASPATLIASGGALVGSGGTAERWSNLRCTLAPVPGDDE